LVGLFDLNMKGTLNVLAVIYGCFELESLFSFRKIQKTGVTMDGIKAKLKEQN